LDLDILWDVNFNDATPTELNTTQLPIGRYSGTNLALTIGQVDASFNNDEIPPGVWVWCETPYVPADALKRKPIMLTVTLSGYKLPKYIDRFSNVRMLDDTLTLATFGAGGGNATDTLSFTTSTVYGAFFNKGSDTLNVTELRVAMIHGEGLDTLGVQVNWDVNFKDGSPTVLNTVALPIGRYAGTNLALTTGQVDAAFANSKIPPGVWVWATTPYVPADALKRKPIMLTIQLSGYKTPIY
jgi:hypothetical protein